MASLTSTVQIDFDSVRYFKVEAKEREDKVEYTLIFSTYSGTTAQVLTEEEYRVFVDVVSGSF